MSSTLCPIHQGKKGRPPTKSCPECARLNPTQPKASIQRESFRTRANQSRIQRGNRSENGPVQIGINSEPLQSKKCSRHQGRGRAPLNCSECARIKALVEKDSPVNPIQHKGQISPTQEKSERVRRIERELAARQAQREVKETQTRTVQREVSEAASVLKGLEVLGAADKCAYCPHDRESHKRIDGREVCVLCGEEDKRMEVHPFHSFLLQVSRYFAAKKLGLGEERTSINKEKVTGYFQQCKRCNSQNLYVAFGHIGICPRCGYIVKGKQSHSDKSVSEGEFSEGLAQIDESVPSDSGQYSEVEEYEYVRSRS